MKTSVSLSLVVMAFLYACRTTSFTTDSNGGQIVGLSVTTTGSDYAHYIAPSDDENDFSYNENMDIGFVRTAFNYPAHPNSEVGLDHYPQDLLMLYAIALKKYAIQQGYDTSYAFLVNTGILSNKKRFFVINLTSLTIEETGLVSHGRGNGASIYEKQYSNAQGSHCTSLGRYKICGTYNGKYGLSYRMKGLDSSNNNALRRNIVLHSMGCIPDKEGIVPACLTEGCPAVSDQFFNSLRKIIDTRKKPMLLWIFDSILEEPVVNNPNDSHVLSPAATATTFQPLK